jgi:hypothetical protein
MNQKLDLRIASGLLIAFGVVEVAGLVMLLIPQEYLPAGFEGQTIFWALLSAIYGLARIVAGAAIWKNRKWGWVFGLMLSITTMIVAPTIVPFGIIDLILSVLISIFLLIARFGEEKIV